MKESKTLKEWIELAEERGKEIDGLKMKLYHLAKESIQAKEQLKSKDKEIEELKCYINTVKMPIVERYEELEQELQRLREGIRESKLVVDWLRIMRL